MQIKAAVVRERSGPFVIETLDLCAPRPDELIVRVVASGMCQTDLHGRDGYYASPYPGVYGHEGAGIVHAVGEAVVSFAPGDHVVMSFPWCGQCGNCVQHRHSYCAHAFDLKMNGTRADGSTLLSQNGAPVFSAFFQQSSFGTFALTQERYAVKVREDVPLELLGPLACSGQTGAGAVFNVLQPKPRDSFAVFGVGAVGLSALMAAKIAGCDPIVAIDVHRHRLDLARELGATHVIDHGSSEDVVAEVRAVTGGGVRHSIDTSALPKVFREAAECLLPGGTCVLLGSARKGNEVSLEMPFLQEGRVVRGVIQGDSFPKEFIPRLVDLMVDGKFPIEKMITFYDLADINRAAQESSSGLVIKPVLRMPA
ncbi:MAG TPA: NAD(P)-dependent alcohol dehydrogenase [Xanthobacteraceae bacterium]|jgi:aryl-alcohol dehydrogenase|nr:NAD(P)-dependent alcohol dehydrogenase [Xanthobacteraceae bacterium]